MDELKNPDVRSNSKIDKKKTKALIDTPRLGKVMTQAW